MNVEHTDIAVIGAGPGGSMAATLLRQRGWKVTLLERSRFPRFSIGESLLPQCMDWLEQADMLDALMAENFQPKRGAVFSERDKRGDIDYAEHFTPGWGYSWEVPRARFDQVMADEAVRHGVDLRFEQTVDAIDLSTPGAPRLTVRNGQGEDYELVSRFVCDGSGYGRVLPRLLGLHKPSEQPPRSALFAHCEDRIDCPDYDRDQILLIAHPEQKTVWYWLIPFSNGRASVGVTGDPDIVNVDNADKDALLQTLIAQDPSLGKLLENANFDEPARGMTAYSASATALHGQDYALLGNAGEFIDPIFSSGVTVAMKSGVLACDLADRQLNGETIDWDTEYETPLREGSNVFRAFVDAWYDGSLRNVFFYPHQTYENRAMLSSIVAGYVWDKNNPYVAKPRRRLRTLCNFCAA